MNLKNVFPSERLITIGAIVGLDISMFTQIVVLKMALSGKTFQAFFAREGFYSIMAVNMILQTGLLIVELATSPRTQELWSCLQLLKVNIQLDLHGLILSVSKD